MENKNQIDTTSSQQDVQPVKDTRRAFMKKAVYSTPVLLVLGQLALPRRAGAEYLPDNPPWLNQ